MTSAVGPVTVMSLIVASLSDGQGQVGTGCQGPADIRTHVEEAPHESVLHPAVGVGGEDVVEVGAPDAPEPDRLYGPWVVALGEVGQSVLVGDVQGDGGPICQDLTASVGFIQAHHEHEVGVAYLAHCITQTNGLSSLRVDDANLFLPVGPG